MLVDVSQRWKKGRSIFVPPAVVFDPRRYFVAPIASDNEARAFVEEHHYSRSYPAARERFGLYEGAKLVGVAVFSHPTNDKVLTRLPCDRLEGVELGRLVLLDHVPFNAESWTIARCFDLLRKLGYRGVVSFSDPCPRFADGQREPVFPGHAGQIYRASNATYAGRSTQRTLRIFKSDGTILNARSLQKVLAAERGWRSVVEMLMARGASDLPESASAVRREAWVNRWRFELTRPMRHSGNLVYLFGLDGRTKKMLPPSLPYPKLAIMATMRTTT